MVAKEKFSEMGISPNEFRNMRMSDIMDVLDLNEAWKQKAIREQKIQEAVNSLKH